MELYAEKIGHKREYRVLNLEYQSLKHTGTPTLQHTEAHRDTHPPIGILVSTLLTLIVIPVVYYAPRIRGQYTYLNFTDLQFACLGVNSSLK